MNLPHRIRACWNKDLAITEDELAERIIEATAQWFETIGVELPGEVWTASEWAARALRAQVESKERDSANATDVHA